MLHTKFRRNGPTGSEDDYKGFYHIWARNDLDLQYSHTFINSISCLHQNPLFSLFPIEKPKIPNLTLP